MPTIEIVSIDCSAIPDLPCYRSFAYRAETQLVSHRALFQPIFDKLNGIIVHLENKEMEGEHGMWFAGGIMDWMQNSEDEERELTATAKSIVRVVQEGATELEKILAVKQYLLIRSIIPEECETVLRFLPETLVDIIDLMQRLLCASSQHRITFSTDYQFGGESRICGEITLAEFVKIHDQRTIWYNELYFIRSE